MKQFMYAFENPGRRQQLFGWSLHGDTGMILLQRALSGIQGVFNIKLLLPTLLLIGSLALFYWTRTPLQSQSTPPHVEQAGEPVQEVAPWLQQHLPIIRHAGTSEENGDSTTYYVSKEGSNRDGRSWATAWNELDQIDWEVIRPGDTILLDGGASQMVYNSTLTLKTSGTSEHPITIKLASETGRNGQVVIFGGRSTPLPYCDQEGYDFETEGVRDLGIALSYVSWVVIDGEKWRGIVIYGHNRYGVELYESASDITIRNIEVFDNGTAFERDGKWLSDLPGVNLGGTNIVFERAIVHDNGQDAFQWNDTIHNFALRQSWLYNSRRHPTVNDSFNYCTHSDGIQIYNGGLQSGFHVEASIIGPGFSNGVLMGQSWEPSGIQATTDHVTLRNVLFTKATDNNIAAYSNTKPKGWQIDHVTSDCPNTLWQCLYIEGPGHKVSNSIFVGSSITLPDGLDSYSGNCQWKTEGFDLGEIANPLFVDTHREDPLSLDNYEQLPNSPCAGKGSNITSVAQLLGQPDPDRVMTKLSWEAEEGWIAPPFMVTDSYIVQHEEIDEPVLSGRASYKFTITTPGDYLVTAIVDAPDQGANSVLINIDGEPNDPEMTWDIRLTDGFQERTASWRGADNTFLPAPQVFTLASGEHELIIRGIEGNVRLDRIRLKRTS